LHRVGDAHLFGIAADAAHRAGGILGTSCHLGLPFL